MEKINIYLPFGMLGLNTITLLVNLLSGMLMGWFLLDEIKLKINRCQNIVTICILLLLSLYQYFYYMPIMGNLVSPEFFYAVKYPQLLLGIYLILYLQRILKSSQLMKG